VARWADRRREQLSPAGTRGVLEPFDMLGFLRAGVPSGVPKRWARTNAFWRKVFGRRRLDYLIREYVAHYTHERPHQSLENRTIVPLPTITQGEVRRKTRLTGLLRHYHRAAA